MVHLHQLWLPIVLSSVVVFFLSFLFHSVLPNHKNDFAKVPEEDKVMAALRAFKIPPGDYMMPRPDSRDAMKDPAFLKKMSEGPSLHMTIFPTGPFNLGGTLAVWFVYLLCVSVIVAYVCSRAVPPAAHYLTVFRFAGVTAFASYALAQAQESIWFRRKWSTTIKNVIDGLIYGLFTAGVFGWLWPR